MSEVMLGCRRPRLNRQPVDTNAAGAVGQVSFQDRSGNVDNSLQRFLLSSDSGARHGVATGRPA